MRRYAFLLGLCQATALLGCAPPEIDDESSSDEAALNAKCQSRDCAGITQHDPLPGHSYTEAVESMRDLGIHWVRLKIDWCRMEPTPPENGVHHIDFNVEHAGARFEEQLDQVRAAGINVMANVVCVPDWANCDDWGKTHCEKHGPFYPPNSPDYLFEFLRAASSHYGDRIAAYAPFAEFNAWGTGATTPADVKARIIKPAFEGIRAGNPAATILTPNSLINNDHYSDPTDYLYSNGQPIIPFDRVGMHVHSVDDQNVNQILGHMTQLNGWCKKHKQCKGFWVTETGMDAGHDGKAQGLKRIFNHCGSLKLCDRVMAMSLYDPVSTEKLESNVNNGATNYGLFEHNGEMKRARYCGLQKAMRGAKTGVCAGRK